MSQQQKQIRLAILGAGGLGKGMLQRAELTQDFLPVAIADSSGYLFDVEGLDTQSILNSKSLAEVQDVIPSPQAILDLFATHKDEIDAVFMALPNLPVEFIPNITKQLVERVGFRGIFVDALKRTKAVELMLELDDSLQKNQVLYITGAGATPGFLSTVAAVAAQSFVEVEAINIHFGVGISNWEAYKATIREDFIHMPGFTPAQVANMTDADIEAELAKRNGLLELVDMEHADDIILELAGVCDRSKVTVGGIVDTKNAKKPVSTTVSITGKTVSGQTGTTQLTLADETTMVDNVCGPALGFVRQGMKQYRKGLTGVITSADIMPIGNLEPNCQTIKA